MSDSFNEFGLSPEHIEFQSQFRRFVDDRLIDIAVAAEAEGRFPVRIYEELAAHGYLAVNYDEDVGGGGGDLLMGCIFYEELTRASAGISAGVFAHQHLAVGPILKFGNEAQRGAYLEAAIAAERIGAFCLTEPDAGSDIRGLRAFARRERDGWVINGSKLYITNGTIADFLIVAARTGEKRDDASLTLFLVDAATAGIESSELKKVGNHSSSTALISLDDVRVPFDAVLGTEGQGLKQLKSTLVEGRILVANRGLGIGQESLELAQSYAQQRRAFGQLIGKFQGVGFKIAEMAIRADAARLMIYRAARRHMAGLDASTEASMAKFLASELAVEASKTALLLHGGAGYMEETKIARLYRDAPEAWIGEGTNEIQLSVVGKSLGLL